MTHFPSLQHKAEQDGDFCNLDKFPACPKCAEGHRGQSLKGHAEQQDVWVGVHYPPIPAVFQHRHFTGSRMATSSFVSLCTGPKENVDFSFFRKPFLPAVSAQFYILGTVQMSHQVKTAQCLVRSWMVRRLMGPAQATTSPHTCVVCVCISRAPLAHGMPSELTMFKTNA